MRSATPLLFAAVATAGAAVSTCAPAGGVGGDAAPAPAVGRRAWSASLADTLRRLAREDQDGRADVARAVTAGDTAVLHRMERADSARSRWLRAVVRVRGWPTRALVGDSASQAAWLLLQHSPSYDFQREMLPRLEQAAARGDLSRADLALLTDRVLVHDGRPQRYGSQFAVAGGRLVADPIDDLPRLDTRRAAVGLPPMAEYVRMLGEFYKLPVTWPPA